MRLTTDSPSITRIKRRMLPTGARCCLSDEALAKSDAEPLSGNLIRTHQQIESAEQGAAARLDYRGRLVDDTGLLRGGRTDAEAGQWNWSSW
jgi:hypothetical protein